MVHPWGKSRGREASSTARRARRGRDCPGSARVLQKSGLGTSGLGSTYEWAWIIGSIRENHFHERFLEGQSAKYLHLDNSTIRYSTIYTQTNTFVSLVPTLISPGFYRLQYEKRGEWYFILQVKNLGVIGRMATLGSIQGRPERLVMVCSYIWSIDLQWICSRCLLPCCNFTSAGNGLKFAPLLSFMKLSFCLSVKGDSLESHKLNLSRKLFDCISIL